MTRFITVLVLMVFVAGIGFLAVSAHDMTWNGAQDPGDDEVPGDSTFRFNGGDGLASFGVHRTAQLEATHNCNGTAGRGYHGGLVPADTGAPDFSFVSPPGSNIEYLFGLTVWVGGVVGNDTLVSVGADGWSAAAEMFPPDWPHQGSVVQFDYIADHSITTQCVDTFVAGVDPDYFGRPHVPLNVDIEMASLSWDQAGLDEVIIYDLRLLNSGAETINDGYVGIYVDGDVGLADNSDHFFDDLAGTSPDNGIAYIIDNDGDYYSMPSPAPKLFALKLLYSSFAVADTNFNWWVSNGNAALDFGPRLHGTPMDPFRDFLTGGIGTPEGDVNKYYVLSHSEWDYDQIYTASIPPDDPVWLYPHQGLAGDISNGFDTRFLLSLGPISFGPGEGVRILFATFTADSVHTDPNNIANLPDNPDAYLAGLNFGNVLVNVAVADSLAEVVLSTPYPVAGLHVSDRTDSTVTVRWQRPWFESLDGFYVYLSEVPPEELPYPGIPAPWLRPDELVLEAEVGTMQSEYTFENLEPRKIYFVNVAKRFGDSAGDPGKPIFIQLGAAALACPGIPSEYIFLLQSEPATIEWSPPPGVAVDHYRLYRGDSAWAAIKYHPFYDEGRMTDFITPVDSFYITDEGITYYYYAMEPWVELDASDTSFVDPAPIDDGMYFVSAVDTFGIETDFSDNVQLHFVEPRTKDILVIIGQHYVTSGVTIPSLVAFYDSLLFGYDYDFYFQGDSIHYNHCPDGDLLCFDWHDFMRYEMLLIDDGFRRSTLEPQYEHQVKGFTRYLLSGGRLAVFGPLSKMLEMNSFQSPGIYPAEHWFVHRFFGIDSMAFMGIGYCAGSISCHQYTGFLWAESIDGSMPDVAYNPDAPFTNLVHVAWPCGQCAPDVASFKV
ncbi:MAG: fibronectin type III domain-containing protein, partial [candidate division Zixibacteria bacterium]|nr:fibronectin type III domain-containing protein [candidate division Zixibacteria bacterium]